MHAPRVAKLTPTRRHMAVRSGATVAIAVAVLERSLER